MGHKVYFFGDCHFSAMHPWLIEAGDKFIDWFKNQFSSSHKDDTVVFLGDITDKAVNPGGVIAQAFELFKFCDETFKTTYILTGNHDKKLYRDREQNSLTFLGKLPYVDVIEEPGGIELDNNKTILALPHLRVNGSLNDFYNSVDWEPITKKYGKFDVGIGHWAIQDTSFMFSKTGVDITKIPAKKWVVGHIHTRPRPEYTGSIWPCNHTEQVCNYPRCYKAWDLETDTWEDIKLPEFLRFEEIIYPNKAPANTDKNGPVKVFVVKGIKNKSEAEAFYAGLHIRDVNRNVVNKDMEDVSSTDEIFLYKDNKEALDAMIEETKMEISPAVYDIISEII